MARTRATDFDDKQQLILDMAADLFAVKGFSVTTTTEIAVACGMSKSALYHYHRSKEAILFSLLIAHLRGVLKQVQEAVDAHADQYDRFNAFLRALLESNALSRSKNIVLLNETGGLAPEQAMEIKRLEKKLVQLGTELLKPLNMAVMARSELRMPYTMLLFGLVNWTYTWYNPKGPLSPAEIAARIGEVFLRGFPQAAAVSRPTMRARLRQVAGARAK